MQNKRNRHGRQGHNIETEPKDSLHLGNGERVRLEDIPESDANGDLQVGNRKYNDARYKFKGVSSNNAAVFLEGGYLVWTGSGLNFNRPRTTYLLPGIDTPITVEATTVPFTLSAANSTNPRFDRPKWDSDGNFSILEGIPAPDPGIPSVTDPINEIAGSSIFIPAASTRPDPNIVSTLVYDENLGTPDEWAASGTGTGTVDFADTSDPNQGTIAAKATNVQNNFGMRFIAAANVNVADITQIGFDLKLLAQLFSGQDIKIQFFNNFGQSVSSQVTLSVNKTNINSYQFVSLNASDFSFTASQFLEVRIIYRRLTGDVNHIGFLVDNVILQGGIIPPMLEGAIELTGHITGSGQTGQPIEIKITEKAISEQIEQAELSENDFMIVERNNELYKIKTNKIITNGIENLDGGFANSIYLVEQLINGGPA